MYSWKNLSNFVDTIPKTLLTKKIKAIITAGDDYIFTVAHIGLKNRDKFADYYHAEPSWPNDFPYIGLDDGDITWNDLKQFIKKIPPLYMNAQVISSGSDFYDITDCAYFTTKMCNDFEGDEDNLPNIGDPVMLSP